MDKPCFGQFLTESCQKNGGHIHCDQEIMCLDETNQNGPCDCRYKVSCHLGRQQLEARFRNEGLYQKVTECQFYKMIQERRECMQ